MNVWVWLSIRMRVRVITTVRARVRRTVRVRERRPVRVRVRVRRTAGVMVITTVRARVRRPVRVRVRVRVRLHHNTWTDLVHPLIFVLFDGVEALVHDLALLQAGLPQVQHVHRQEPVLGGVARLAPHPRAGHDGAGRGGGVPLQGPRAGDLAVEGPVDLLVAGAQAAAEELPRPHAQGGGMRTEGVHHLQRVTDLYRRCQGPDNR